MTEEARQRLNELVRERRAQLGRNALAITSCIVTMIMAVVLLLVLRNVRDETTIYVEAAQRSVKSLCEAVEGQPLPADAQRDCAAAQRNELPEVLQSVVDNPDPDDPENQDSENQDSEIQDPEVQDSETQDPELQEPEGQDPETDETELQDPEEQESEIQETEIQDPEIQDPEEQNAPICPAGYERGPFHWNGPDEQPGTADDEDWLVCKKVV